MTTAREIINNILANELDSISEEKVTNITEQICKKMHLEKFFMIDVDELKKFEIPKYESAEYKISEMNIDDVVYMESRGKILKYVVESITINRNGKTFHAYCEDAKHDISFPEKWIGEQIFLSEETAKLDFQNFNKVSKIHRGR